MIVANGLTKYYGQFAAIEQVDFSVEKGEIIGFLGPNGAGKTTTMRVLTGFTPPSRGTAEIAGYDITKDPVEVKRRVGYLPESVPLYDEMLVCSFLSYVAEVKGVASGQRRLEVERVMERCGLSHMSHRVLRNLSKGYRQRVGLAQALIGNPPVLILDEPTVGLDPQQIIEIRQMIKELGADHTVLLSTHILPEVTMVCQRVLIINKGRIVAQDTMQNLAGANSVIELEVSGETSAAAAALEKVGELVSFSSEGATRFTAVAKEGCEPGPAVTKALIEAGVGVVSLRRRTQTLEDIFLRSISGDEAANAGGAK